MKSTDAIKSLSALAQESRLSVFRMLVKRGPEGYTPTQLGEKLNVPSPTLSFHLKELSHARLVSCRQEGRFLYYSADFERMAAVMTFLTHNCCKGMPQECLTVMETALGDCLPSATKRRRAKSNA